MSRTCTSEQWFRARAHDPRIIEALERQRRIAGMRAAGATLRQIADHYGISVSRAKILHTKAMRHLSRIPSPVEGLGK